MHLTDLSLTDFRSHSQVVLRLNPGVTALIGPNGQGKTNILEAIGYLATLSSHRVAADSALIRVGAERAVIRAKVVKATRSVLVDLEILAGKSNKARVGRAPLPKVRDLLGLVGVVQFAPEDLSLVKGGPEGRRRYLDDLLIQSSPRLYGVLADYDRVIRQRSALLKSAGHLPAGARSSAMASLEVWDDKAADLGGAITAARLDLVAKLAPATERAYRAVAPALDKVEMRYQASVDLPAEGGKEAVVQSLAAAMKAGRAAELERGHSLYGPHREDLTLSLHDLPARGYASHGESWSLALALKLAAFEVLREQAGDDPILILDDVFAELDTSRRARLAEAVGAVEQVLISAAVDSDVPGELAGDRFSVDAGEVNRER
jgi:DNA replication and repair protein RecF